MDINQNNEEKEKGKGFKDFDIPFVLGEETRPKIEKFTNDKFSVRIQESIFYRQYCTALSGIAEFVNYQYENQYYTEYEKPLHNNIFVFNGDRGSGKTSCMMTVKELLCTRNKDYAEFGHINQELQEKLCATNFLFFDMIDPVHFDNQHNILDLFIGTLFKNFQYNERNKRNYSNRFEEKDRLLKQFSKTRRNLSVLNKTVTLSEFDDLEQLNDLAASISFKQSLDDLVKYYIRYMSDSDKPDSNTHLVLCIDDIDLNLSEGYEMIEQIRKYMNIKRLIILMAIKIDQLGDVIRIKYAKDFKPLLEQESGSYGKTRKYDAIINEIVERYITKLFPINHRIQLPTVASLLDRSISIFQYNNDGKLKHIECLETLKDGILKLIYNKTRMMIYNSRSRVSYIIPMNLRELLNFIHLLSNMEDVSRHEEAIPNLMRFKEYFYGVWCTNNLDEEGLNLIRKTQDVLFAQKVNQMIIRMLEQRFAILQKIKDTFDKTDNTTRELINILDVENIMYNTSLGDVLACIDWLDKVCDKEKDLKLLFAIKVFYSIYLYEGFRTSKEIQDRNKKFEAEIINRELLTDNDTDYGDILNGNFFNSEYINAAPYEKGEISRCRRVVNRESITNIRKGKDLEKDKISDFFILTTSFVFESTEKPNDDKNNSVFSKYRKKKEVYYEKEIGGNRKYVCFDILSIFYNLLNIEKAYKRYNIKFAQLKKKEIEENKKKIAEIAEIEEFKKFHGVQKNGLDWVIDKENEVACKIKNSPLYKEILEVFSENLPPEVAVSVGNNEQLKEKIKNIYFWKEDSLLYRLNIRNVELLEQISYRLQRERPYGDSNNIEPLKKMFNTLSEFTIKTYKDEEIEYYFFKAIHAFLENLDNNDDLKNCFNSIYVDKEAVVEAGNENKKQA